MPNEGIADISSYPKVTLLIVTFNRRASLEKALKRFAAQRYPNTEIVVLDDGSSDGTLEMLQSRSDIITIALNKNVGPALGRNIAQSRATGEFILNLDDDSWLESDESLTEIVRRMIAEPEIAVFAMNIRDKTNELMWAPDQSPFEVPYYIGCANVYRASALSRVGNYVSEFYRQGEEVERSLRIYNEGYKIVALPHISVFHEVSPLNRDQKKINELDVRNAILRELINAPILLLPFALCRVLFSSTRLLGPVATMRQIADICRSTELIRMLLRRRRSVNFVRYIRWKIMMISQSYSGQ